MEMAQQSSIFRDFSRLGIIIAYSAWESLGCASEIAVSNGELIVRE